MATVAQWFNRSYEEITTDSFLDPEVDSWLLMNNSIPICSILMVYLFFVVKLGPELMKHRTAFHLKKLMLIYNFSMIVLNGYIFINISSILSIGTGSIPWHHLCYPIERREESTFARTHYRCCWYYLLSKVIELLDTVFFVLRKKQSQVTILHVYHHTNMAISTWAYLKYLRGEQGVVIGVLNSLVHIIMYLYYFLAAFGPNVQKYLWWKKHLTKLQLMQFCIIIVYMLSLLAFDCKLHKALSIYMAINTTTFLILFLNFYRKAYKSHKLSTNNNEKSLINVNKKIM